MCSATTKSDPICIVLPAEAPLHTQAIALCLVAEAVGALPVGGAARLMRQIPTTRALLVTLAPWVATEPCLARRCRKLIAQIDAKHTDLGGLTFQALATV